MGVNFIEIFQNLDIIQKSCSGLGNGNLKNLAQKIKQQLGPKAIQKHVPGWVDGGKSRLRDCLQQ